MKQCRIEGCDYQQDQRLVEMVAGVTLEDCCTCCRDGCTMAVFVLLLGHLLFGVE